MYEAVLPVGSSLSVDCFLAVAHLQQVRQATERLPMVSACCHPAQCCAGGNGLAVCVTCLVGLQGSERNVVER